MKPRHAQMYMEMAEVAAKNSYATRLKVGAIAVKDHRIVSVGYNGTAPGRDNNCEGSDGLTKSEVIHAETNLIYKLARDGQSGAGADLFVTHSPCMNCSLAILSVGFRKVWFRNQYRDLSGVEFLRENGIEVDQLCE